MDRTTPGASSAIIVLRALLFVVCWASAAATLLGQEDWQAALRKMHLSPETPLNRENCLQLLLAAFESNQMVKAMVILPSVTDDFYLISRDRLNLNFKAGDLFTALAALTNVTSVR